MPFVLTAGQHSALGQISAWLQEGSQKMMALSGPAGTGKTTLLREIASRHDVVLCAMTGRAAQRVQALAGQEATTLHKILYWPPRAGETLSFTEIREAPGRLVVIDEASMMGPQVYLDLQAWADRGVKILLVGDSFQLPPVISEKETVAYGEDFSIFCKVSGPELSEVMRNAGGVLRAANRVRESGKIWADLELDPEGGGYVFQREINPLQTAVDEFLKDPQDHLLITWRNQSRMAANKLVRAGLGLTGPVPDPGEPVWIRRSGQGYLNGDIVECGGFDDGPKLGDLRTLWMRVGRGGEFGRILVSVDGSQSGEFFDGGSPWIANWRTYQAALKRGLLPEPLPITWGYCLTAHGAQGAQARRTTVFLSKQDLYSSNFCKPTTLPSGKRALSSARWIYTAITRSTFLTKMVVGR